jgi:branched-chain amino acid transport system permease protein
MRRILENFRTKIGRKGWILFLIFGIGLFIFPYITQNAYVIHIFIISLLFAVLSLSWNFICGYTGIFTLGHQGFFGIGAYFSALLAMKAGVSPWLGLLIGGFVSSLLSIFIGVPCLRLRGGAYVALTTLGFAEIARIVCMNLVGFTRGELGLWGVPTLPNIPIGSVVINFSGVSRVPYYYVIVIIFLVAFSVLYRQIQSPMGLALKAIRESQDAAESLGVPITRYKLISFMVSSFFAGVAGAFYAHYINILTPSSMFNVGIMVEIIAITLIGGLGTFSGPIMGSFILIIGLEWLRVFGEYRFIIYGALMVITIIFMPQGFVRRLIPGR